MTLYGLAHHFYWELKSIDEGLFRIVVDKEKKEQLMQEAEDTSGLSLEAITELEQGVDRQIQAGWVAASEREISINALREEIRFHRQFAAANSAIQLSQKHIRIPKESGIIDRLLKATNPEQIRQICRDAVVPVAEKDSAGSIKEIMRPNWSISSASMLPSMLTQYASEFLAAKKDLRFPKSGRPTSRLKKLWFLSRALAGAVYGIEVRTAINRVGSMRPDEIADLTRLSKRTRRPRKAAKRRI